MIDEKTFFNFVGCGQAAQKAVDKLTAGNWLPDDCRVDLTQLELGALLGILHEARRHGFGSAIVNKPGPDGRPVPISIISRLIEKVEASIQERKSR